jgi:hypothetical protein
VTCAENRTITAETRRFGRELYNTRIREIFVATSIENQIYHSGTDETIQAWTGPDRSTYSATSYTRPESSSFDLFQASLLFADVHRLAFDAMPPSTGKADFLLSKLPLKTLERDQLICEALGYPALNCLNDMTMVEQRVMTETDIHALHILREGFQNQGLAHVAEARLHELCTQDINLFLSHPTITAIRSNILGALPETVHETSAF